jgi:hypothetical protein
MIMENGLKDLRGEYVLISECFVYLGDQYIKIPSNFIEICPTSKHRDYITIKNEKIGGEFIHFILKKYNLGLNGKPINWREYDQLQLL